MSVESLEYQKTKLLLSLYLSFAGKNTVGKSNFTIRNSFMKDISRTLAILHINYSFNSWVYLASGEIRWYILVNNLVSDYRKFPPSRSPKSFTSFSSKSSSHKSTSSPILNVPSASSHRIFLNFYLISHPRYSSNIDLERGECSL